jgi:lysyl-tRNA synthetase class 2
MLPRPLRLIAMLTALDGLVLLLSTLRQFGSHLVRLQRVINPFDYQVETHVATLAIGVGLLYLAGNLARRKHAAWVVAVVLFAGAAVVQVIHLVEDPHGSGVSVAQLAFASMMVVLLIVARRQFYADSDPPSLLQFIRFVPLYAAVVLGYGLVTLHLAREHLDRAPTFGNDLLAIGAGLVGMDGPYEYRGKALGELFPLSLMVFGVAGLGVTLVLVFRPIVARPRANDDWERARELVCSYGTDTLSYFALRHDKSYFFSSDGRAVIAYAYLGRCALASGDPIGHPDSIDLVIDEFVEMCRRHSWGHAFLAVREDEAERYLRRGLRSFYLGDEAVIDCDQFILTGKRNKSMRQSVGRVARSYRFVMIPEIDADPELRSRLNDLSDRWRGKAPERGFTMSLGQAVNGDEPEWWLCVAVGEDGKPGGFLRIVPVAGDSPGFTLDMMRRDPASPNGMTEFLVANTAMALQGSGYKRLSMNFAVFGRLFGDDLGFTRRQKMLRAMVSLLNPFFQIKSLHDFNRRFRPTWVARTIIYEDQRSLPRIALLYGGVEGFLALPFVGTFFVPRRVEAVPELVPCRSARLMDPSREVSGVQ